MTDLTPALLGDLRSLIDGSRQRTAINSELVLLYWKVGHRIHTELLGEERAAYGKQIVSTLSRQLVPDYGLGFGRANLYRMVQFAQVFPDEEIVSALRRQLTWTHLRELVAIDDPLTEGALRVASYLSELRDRALLERKLIDSIKLAKARLRNRVAADRRELEQDRRELDADRQELTAVDRDLIAKLGARPRMEKLRIVLLVLLKRQPWTSSELARALHRDPENLVRRHLGPIVESGQIKRTRPDAPTDPNQAYYAAEGYWGPVVGGEECGIDTLNWPHLGGL